MKRRGAFYNKISVLILSALLVLLSSAMLGFFLSRIFFMFSILVLPLGYFLIKRIRESRKDKLLLSLRKKWGTYETQETDSAEIGKYFKRIAPIGEQEHKYIVDDRTWNDLDMDLIYGRLNQTLTVPGEQMLYALLRTPKYSRKPLEERSEIINLFIQDQELRERIQIFFLKLGKSGGRYVVELLWDERPAPNKLAFLYPCILLFIPIFVLLGLLGHNLAWVGLIALSLGNAAIHYRTKRKFAEDIPSIRYLGRMLKYANHLSGLQNSRLEDYWMQLKSVLDKVAGIAPKTALLSLGENNALYEYLNIIFLMEVRAFHSYLRLMDKFENQLREIFETIGFLDSMIAAASYKAGLKKSVEPELTDSILFLDIVGVMHPLLEKPVPNSLSLRKGGMLITGSNMSGKTTFLKTIGVNMIFAQTLHFCLAKRFASSFFNTLTLIGRKDNIIEGKSYYLDEILALLRIIRASQQDIPCLCLIDELFRGTNSVERISASAELLLYLAKKNDLVFASTHDLELTHLVADAYVNYHFQEEIGEHGLLFNYQLHEGPSETRNAIKLLHHVGYPDEITEGAEQRIRGSK
jgi:DNA mismatch repair ATPase MutS